MRRRFALVAGGGTAGHVLPALAVARAIAEQHGEGSVEMVGSKRGLEADLLDSGELPVTLLSGRGIARRMDVSTLVANCAAAAGIAWACVRALVLVALRRPAVVVSVGGYASVPCALAAVVERVPLVLVNVDAVPGAANRLFGRFARACAVAFPATALPRAVLTGAPVREAVLAAKAVPARRTEARRSLGLPGEALVVGAFGGSLGSRRVNDAIVQLAEIWAGRSDCAIYHVVGRREASRVAECWTKARSRLEASGVAVLVVYVQVPFEEHVETLYEACDLVVCRAGAMTVAELTAVGVPSILVPLPGAPGDHQGANARAVVEAGGALLVKDGECNGARLVEEISAMTKSRRELQAMAEAARSLGRKDAARSIAAVADAHARPRGEKSLL